MDSKKSVAKSETEDMKKKLATELAKDAKEVESKAAGEVKKAASATKKKASTAKKAVSKASASAKKTVEKAGEAVKKTVAKVAAKASDTSVKVEIQDDFGNSKNIDDIKAEILANTKKKSVKKIDVYVKPSQNAVYYVADGDAGSIKLFG